MRKNPKNYKEAYNDFWKAIVENKDGSLNIDQIKKELADYSELMYAASVVYDHVTGGRISKTNTVCEVVMSEADANYERIYEEDIQKSSPTDVFFSREIKPITPTKFEVKYTPK